MKISKMKNLGPAIQADLEAAGVTNAQKVIKLGAKKTFLKMLDGRLIRKRSANCCNALYLYAIYGAINEIDWREVPEDKKKDFKKFTS